MQRITGSQLAKALPYFIAVAEQAKNSTCYNGKCGTVIVNGGKIIGQGFNGPALNDEANRTCRNDFDLSKKPKYDKTCCIHAEWWAILDACKHNADQISGATLYFMRVDEGGQHRCWPAILHYMQPPYAGAWH